MGHSKSSTKKTSRVSLQEYRKLIVRSGLLTPDVVRQQHLEFQANTDSPDVDSSNSNADPTELIDDEDAIKAAAKFARHLENNGLLTRWQNANLLRGRYRGLMFGKFRILRMLGAGGMGRVFLAENEMLQRRVALKVLPKKLSSRSSALDRFHREARALARLNHDNIVRVHDVDVQDRTHYIVMEFVQGVDLYRKVAKEGPLDEAIAANFVMQAAAGLSHAHEAGLIHRDVKPANMLIDNQGTVKVLDLGLALLESEQDESLTADPSRALGTVDYISPEQALSSHELDARTDIYSLGCTLYYLLTGKAPFGKGTSAERLLAHQLKETEPINNVRIELSLLPVDERLVGVCNRMMAKSADDRFASAAEVAVALSPLAGSAKAVGLAIGSSSYIANSADLEGSQSTLDTESLEQLKTISESASNTSSFSIAKQQKPSDRLRKTKSKKKPPVVWAAATGGVAILLVAAGIFWMQGSPSDSAANQAGPPVVSSDQRDVEPLFVVGKGRVYHTSNCQHLRGKNNTRQITQRMAKAPGLRACKICRPTMDR
jgi:serine/threonine-protein kinase